jgi:hypothetical protein
MELQIGDRHADEAGEYEIIRRPYTMKAGKDVHARVKKVDQPDVTEIKDLGRARADQGGASECRGEQAMKQLRRASVTVALSLLTSAATASAECAWVLWEERPIKSGQWRIATTSASTFEAKRSCDDTAATANSSETSRAQGSEPPSLFRCLPDTVDPRGPKEK